MSATQNVLEYPIQADVALPMAAAATATVAQVLRIRPVGGIGPEHVVTPSIHVDRGRSAIPAPRVPEGRQ